MFFVQVDFGTPRFDEILHLRDKILREPLTLTFSSEQISNEYDCLHFACYSFDFVLLGTLLMQVLNPTTLKMRQVAVDTSAQNLGVGTFMVHEIEDWTLANGYSVITLAARREAIPFYKRLHYKCIGNPFTEVGIEHRKMKKNL